MHYSPQAPVPAPVTGPAPASKLHVLVVDDVLMNRDIASAFMRAAGHEVTCLESGAEAVAAVAVTHFDVVLMDIRMPGMDGLEATRRIRTIEGGRLRVPIVALTAQAFKEQVADCHAAGMDDHLSKTRLPPISCWRRLQGQPWRASPIRLPPPRLPRPLTPRRCRPGRNQRFSI